MEYDSILRIKNQNTNMKSFHAENSGRRYCCRILVVLRLFESEFPYIIRQKLKTLQGKTRNSFKITNIEPCEDYLAVTLDLKPEISPKRAIDAFKGYVTYCFRQEFKFVFEDPYLVMSLSVHTSIQSVIDEYVKIRKQAEERRAV